MSDETEENWLECERCGEKKESVRLRSDPYIAEVHHEDVDCYYCDECYDSRHDDV